MKKILLLFLLIFSIAFSNAQNYQISFTGSGASTIVDSVKVENLSQCISLNIGGNDTLSLISTVGINDLGSIEDNSIKLYPNPSPGNCLIDFKLPTQSKTTIGLYDITGKIILKSEEFLSQGHHIYNLTGIKNGIYFLKIESDNYTCSAKLVSVNSIDGEIELNHVESVSMKNCQTTDSETGKNMVSKIGKSIIGIQYLPGDVFLFKGKSGIYSTISTLVPNQNQTVNFNFSPCTDADSNHYTVVQIGTQTWMAENLRTTKYSDGTAMINGTGAGDLSGNTTKYYFDYANTPAMTAIFGKLYTWAATMNGAITSNSVPSGVQGACPSGWHIPSDAEWNIMDKYVDSSVDTTAAGWIGTDVAGKLKATCTTFWNSPNTGATDSSGFSALAGGHRYVTGPFYWIYAIGYWWSSSEYNTYNILIMTMSSLGSNAYIDLGGKEDACSVRCVKN